MVKKALAIIGCALMTVVVFIALVIATDVEGDSKSIYSYFFSRFSNIGNYTNFDSTAEANQIEYRRLSQDSIENEKNQATTGFESKWILIDKEKFELSLFDGGELINKWGVALGKNSGQKEKIGDNKTPEGSFFIEQIQDASSWAHDFKDGKGSIKGAYGPFFLRLSTPPFKGIGIHGTHDPASIGTLASEGCIRMNNEDIRELKKHIFLNMLVEIKQGSVDP